MAFKMLQLLVRSLEEGMKALGWTPIFAQRNMSAAVKGFIKSGTPVNLLALLSATTHKQNIIQTNLSSALSLVPQMRYLMYLQVFYYSHFTGEEIGAERLSDLPQVTQLERRNGG